LLAAAQSIMPPQHSACPDVASGSIAERRDTGTSAEEPAATDVVNGSALRVARNSGGIVFPESSDPQPPSSLNSTGFPGADFVGAGDVPVENSPSDPASATAVETTADGRNDPEQPASIENRASLTNPASTSVVDTTGDGLDAEAVHESRDNPPAEPASSAASRATGGSVTGLGSSIVQASITDARTVVAHRKTDSGPNDQGGANHRAIAESPVTGSGAPLPHSMSAAASLDGPTANAGIEGVDQTIERQLTDAIEAHHSEADQNGETRLEVLLNPPDLGRVWIRLARTADGIAAHLSVQNPDVQSALQTHLDAIRQGLVQSGVPLADFQLARHDADRSFADRDELPTTPVAARVRRGLAANAPTAERGTIRRSGIDLLA
jgi:flagellar hook-length control protein FliK